MVCGGSVCQLKRLDWSCLYCIGVNTFVCVFFHMQINLLEIKEPSLTLINQLIPIRGDDTTTLLSDTFMITGITVHISHILQLLPRLIMSQTQY